jgi:hypothetical protein
MSYADQLHHPALLPAPPDAGDNGVHWIELSEFYKSPNHPDPNSSHAPSNDTDVVRRRNDR